MGAGQPGHGHPDKVAAVQVTVPSQPSSAAGCARPPSGMGEPMGPPAAAAKQGDIECQGPGMCSRHPPHCRITAGTAKTPAWGRCYGNCNILQFH